MHELIMKLCSDKGVSCYQMCKETGIKQNVISNMSSRGGYPSLAIAIKLSDYFGVPIDTFVRKKG